MSLYRYKVAPRSGAKYYDRVERYGELGVCAICGKPVKGEPQFEGHVIERNGEYEWALPDFYENTPEGASDYGCWPIGPDCHKKHVIREGGK